MTVDTVPVATRALQQTVVVSGRVLAPAKIDIGATVTARVARVAVQEGDRVAAGQALVELERSELAAALAQAEAVEAAARTRIAQWREVGAPGAQRQHPRRFADGSAQRRRRDDARVRPRGHLDVDRDGHVGAQQCRGLGHPELGFDGAALQVDARGEIVERRAKALRRVGVGRSDRRLPGLSAGDGALPVQDG